MENLKERVDAAIQRIRDMSADEFKQALAVHGIAFDSIPVEIETMDIKSGQGYPAGALSNFAPHPFTFRGVEIASMEGFLQSLKFKDKEMQKHICTLVGFAAKKAGAKKNWQRDQTLWWSGIPYPRKSDEYQMLLDSVYTHMFTKNEKARKALLATHNANLTHSIGRTNKSETVLTRTEFCSRLMKIRNKFKNDKAFEELTK